MAVGIILHHLAFGIARAKFSAVFVAIPLFPFRLELFVLGQPR